MLKLVQDTTADAVDDPEAMTIDLDEMCRIAAQEMLAVALAAERRAYLEAHAGELDAAGHRLVVGNGSARARKVTTGAGMVEVRAPRVDDRREGERYSSAILPAYMRKSPKVTEVLPILYLRGLSTGDFAPALGEFFGSAAVFTSSQAAMIYQHAAEDRATSGSPRDWPRWHVKPDWEGDPSSDSRAHQQRATIHPRYHRAQDTAHMCVLFVQLGSGLRTTDRSSGARRTGSGARGVGPYRHRTDDAHRGGAG